MQELSPARLPGKQEAASNPLLEAALAYARRGWFVLPLHSPTADGCSCRKGDCNSVGKHPRTRQGVKDASSSPVIIQGWWGRWPDANIGVATGPGSGVFVLDVDGEQGRASLVRLEPLPPTLCALSGRKGPDGKRNGFHLYFDHPNGVALRSSVGTMGKGLDLKAAGGYVVVPPSRHASGLCYEWKDRKATIADAPACLIAKQVNAEDAILSRHISVLFEGERNVVLFRLASSWRRRGAEQDELRSRLLAENSRRCKPPLDYADILQIATSAGKYPPGGPDPLDEAWQKAAAENHFRSYDKFLALVRHLDASRPGQTILLPVVRIGVLIRCDRTLVGRHRRRAIAEGVMEQVEEYIPHQKATRFRRIAPPSSEHPPSRYPTKGCLTSL